MPRLSAKTTRLLGVLAILVLGIVYRMLTQPAAPSSASPEPVVPVQAVSATSTAAVTSTNAQVITVVDGDTIEARMDGQTDVIKIRMLGVNTPETVDPRRPVQCFGKEASDYSKHLLSDKRVRLDSDPQADEIDKYGRYLRNIVLEDGTDFNAALIREGYAYAYVSFPQNAERKVELKRLQEDAKLNARGLWNPTTCNGKP
ncbi:MAG: thermonuclease family protein [bacterium]|nr:thermonuclease family protein [bacterium]